MLNTRDLHTTCSEIGTDALSIVPESTLLLFHREFPTGDCVKRSLTAVESAIVLSSRSEVQAEHVITEERIRSWIPYEDLELAIPVEVGDHVIYDEWIGIIHDVSLLPRSDTTTRRLRADTGDPIGFRRRRDQAS